MRVATSPSSSRRLIIIIFRMASRTTKTSTGYQGIPGIPPRREDRYLPQYCFVRQASTRFAGRNATVYSLLLPSIRYRFGLPRSDDVIGLPIGQHITVAADIDNKTVARSYTPTSSNEDTGHFDLVVKVRSLQLPSLFYTGSLTVVFTFFKRLPQSYEKGNISKYIGNLKLGDKIRVRGPKGQFKYTPGMVSEFSMISGGTGITPMYQIITHILYNVKDSTKINLIYANVNFEDILLKNELDELAKTHKDRFSIYYVLNNPPAAWNGGVGFVSKEMIEEKLHKHQDGKQLLICGTNSMLDLARTMLTTLGSY